VEIHTVSGTVFSEMGRASSEGDGEVSALVGGEASELEPGAPGDEVLPCWADEPWEDEEVWESLETLRRPKVDADRRRMSFRNFMAAGCERESVLESAMERREGGETGG
jgi:hypothetical protein